MKKRSIAIFLAMLMIASVFAACGSSSDSGAPASAAPSGNDASVSSSGGSGEPVNLVFWHMEEPPHRVKRFNEVFEKFNAEHPDIKFTAVLESWNDAYTKFPAAIMAGTGPDLMLTGPDHSTVIYALGKTQPVTDIVEKIHGSQKYFDAATAPYKYGDDFYAVPIYGMVQVLWYRKDMFDAAGLQAPKTWDDLVASAKALTSGDVYGIALPASLTMATDQVVYSFMASAGAQNMITGNDEVRFNTPETVKAYEVYNTLMQYSPPDSTTFAWGEPQALLNSGKAAMAIEKGQYLLPWEDESGHPPEDLGNVLMPTPTGSDSASYYYSNAVILLSESDEKKAAASTFFEWLLEPEIYGEFVNAEPGLFLPSTETGAESPTFLNDPILKLYPQQVKTILDASAAGVMIGTTDGVAMKMGKITGPNIIAATLQQMLGGMSPADAVAWGQAEMEKAINA